MKNNFVPLLFAGDINVYSVARAFHEEYGMKVSAYGKFASGPCMDSKIIDYTAIETVDQGDTFVSVVNDFARKHKKTKVLLVGCGDSYVELASVHKGELADNVIVPYIDPELMHQLIDKEEFYKLCEKHGIDYPKTFIHREDMGMDIELPFKAPYIVKPANGIAYWQHSFEGQSKVYKLNSYLDLQCTLMDIYGAGYEDALIIQEFVPGDDTHMRVLTNYSDQEGKVQMMCMGHVLLEEHTPHGIGNHAVIITEKNKEVGDKFKSLLEDIGYIGFSNFDIKYDARDNSYKAFEINTRQGRSNYYVTGSGGNVAKYLVQDYVEEADLEFESIEEENLWMVVPKKVAFDYIKPTGYKKTMKRLIKEGKYVNPLLYRVDNKPKRRLRVYKSLMSHYGKFKEYLGK